MTKRRAKGEGSLYFWEEKSLWVAKLTLPDGKRKTKYSKTQREVKDWLLEKRKNLKDGLFLDADLSLNHFLNRYLEDYAKHNLRPSTYQSYYNVITKHILPEMGNIQISKLRPDHLNNLYSKKREEGYSPRTIQYIHGVLKRALNKAVKWGLIVSNPLNKADTPQDRKKEMKTWTADEVRTFLNQIEGHRWQAIYILATVGMREGEILGLRWSDVDLENGNLKVVQTVQYIQGMGLVFGEPKTSKAKRLIILPEFVVEALKAHKIKQNELKKSKNWRGQGLVFTTNIGTPISPRNLIRHFKGELEKAGLPDIRFHDLRHTVATLLLEKNIHPLVVSSLLGHSSVNLTLSTYSHVLPALHKDVANTLDDIFE